MNAPANKPRLVRRGVRVYPELIPLLLRPRPGWGTEKVQGSGNAVSKIEFHLRIAKRGTAEDPAAAFNVQVGAVIRKFCGERAV